MSNLSIEEIAEAVDLAPDKVTDLLRQNGYHVSIDMLGLCCKMEVARTSGLQSSISY